MPQTVVTLRNNRFPEILNRLPGAVEEIVETSARNIETTIKTDMAAPKSGAWYGDHQASAPGEAPAIDMSILVNSIQVEPENQTTRVVYTNQEYAVPLEYGAPMANLEPRPFFMPAAEQERSRFLGAMRDLESRLR